MGEGKPKPSLTPDRTHSRLPNSSDDPPIAVLTEETRQFSGERDLFQMKRIRKPPQA
jgi:hypothetical protein